MITWYKRLDKRLRIMLHALCIFVIIAIPTYYGKSMQPPLLMTIIWSIGLFSECFLVLLGHKVKMDRSSSDNAALKRIRKMSPEELEKEHEYLEGKLNELIIPGPGIRLLDGERCLYKGEARVIYDPEFIRYYLGDLCPKNLESDTLDSCPGLLYITTRRVIMEAASYSFKLDYPEILGAQHTGKVLLLLQKYDAMKIQSREMPKIIEVFNLLNQFSMTAPDEKEDELLAERA